MKNLLREVKGNIYGMGCYCFKDVEGEVLYTGSGMMNDRLQSHLYNLKRGLYEGTNKDILQSTYNAGLLSFEVLHFSKNNSEYLNGTDADKKAIQEALEVLEQLYYNLYKDTCCNKMSKIHKRSTSPSKESTIKRHNSNVGSKNPNALYTEEQICNILYLKDYLSVKKVKEIMKKEANIDISKDYIYCLGKTKWAHLRPEYTEWMEKYIKEKTDTLAM